VRQHVNHINRCGVGIFARWWWLGILALARLAFDRSYRGQSAFFPGEGGTKPRSFQQHSTIGENMNPSTNDEIKGNLHEVKGKVKETAGKVTNNPSLEAQGKAEQTAGKVEKKVGQVEKVFGK
jgi:uncharacterized protein YjbJ (UPF0337 family)